MPTTSRLCSGPGPSFSIFMVVSRAWSGVVISICLWCGTGVPEGGILWEQSMMISPYSLHSWHLMWVQCHAMCPGSWHWRHCLSSFDIMLTIEDAMMVAVSCCAALSFFTLIMASLWVCGSFHRFVLLNCLHSLGLLWKILMVAASCVKLQHLPSVFNQWT